LVLAAGLSVNETALNCRDQGGFGYGRFKAEPARYRPERDSVNIPGIRGCDVAFRDGFTRDSGTPIRGRAHLRGQFVTCL